MVQLLFLTNDVQQGEESRLMFRTINHDGDKFIFSIKRKSIFAVLGLRSARVKSSQMNQAYQSVRKVNNCCEHLKRKVTDLVTKMYVGPARCGLN